MTIELPDSAEDIENEYLDELKKLVLEHGQEIKLKLKKAENAIAEAVDLSEKYGIPFEASMFYGTFVPKKFVDKANELDELGVDVGEFCDTVYDLFDVNPSDPEGEVFPGWWQPSRFC